MGAGLARQPARAENPPAETTHVVKKGTLTLEVQTDGVLQPADPFEVRMRFKAYAGSATVLNAAGHGAIVHKGDVLLECDPVEINWAIEGAKSTLETARAGHKKASSDLDLGAKADATAMRIQEQAVKDAEASVKWWNDVDGPQMLLTADLQVKDTRDSLGDQDDELDQLRKMYKSEELTNATADIVLKRALRRLQQTKIHLKMAEDRREKTKAFDYAVSMRRVADALEQARQQLASLKATQAQSAVQRESALSGARVALQQAESKLADLSADRAFFSVKAPADGVVMYGQLSEETRSLRGEKLTAGQVVMRLITPGKLRMEINLTEPQAFWVEAGMKTRVTPVALSLLSYDANCGTPVGAARGNPGNFGFQLPLILPQTDARLLPGMKASVRIQSVVNDVLLVPVAAVSDGKVAIRGKDGKVEDRAVSLGRSDGQSVEVRSGLAIGDEVVLRNKK
jgi:multidrug resistance efflux pump